MRSGFVRYCIDVQYVGPKFSGWIGGLPEANPLSKPGVTQVLKGAFEKFLGANNFRNFKGSSRTDAGVNALCNRFHVDICRPTRKHRAVIEENLAPYDPQTLVRALNFHLRSNDVKILNAREVTSDFNCVGSAKSRTYMYRIASHFKGIDKDTAAKSCLLQSAPLWVVPSHLDVSSMKLAAKYLLGCQDFSTFRNSGCQAVTPIRTVSYLEINDFSQTMMNTVDTKQSLCDAFIFGDYRLLTIVIKSDAFLYRMVRNIVATLVHVGQGKLTPDDVLKMLLAKNRDLAPGPAPAEGLFLVRVEYDEEEAWAEEEERLRVKQEEGVVKKTMKSLI